MSMFYELMMRKKEEIMYATIKGTLTESPGGVFSGFSASDYLALQQNFAPEGSWEVCFKVKMGSNVSLAKYFFGSTSYGIVLGNTDTPSGAFKVFLSSNGTSWDIGNLSTGINNPADSIRYVKIGFTGEKYYIEQSEDGITYIGRAELNSTKKIYSVPVRIGNSYESSNRYWQGAIDLNNSYIKLGSTKYKLQAVVGYTIVGSPTITDGVLSNTSSSNFIRTPNFPEYSSLEAEVVTTISSATSSFQSIFALTGNYAIVFEYRNAVAIRYRIYNDSATEVYSGTYNIVVNQPITINLKIKGNNAVITIIQNGTIKFQSSYSITRITGNSRFQLGYFWQGLTTGSIDLNKTFVKLDNKLWFNGQEG